jgi:hypothetical protein
MILTFLTINIYSQKNIYQFGLGINTIDPLNSQVVSVDYSHSLKNKKWRIGGVFQYANSNFYNSIDGKTTAIYSYYRGRPFVFNNLLKKHESEVGNIKLKSVLQYEQNIFIGPYIRWGWNHKQFYYSFALGAGPIKYTYKGEASGGDAILSLDTTKTGRLITPYIVSGYSLSAYSDFKFTYRFHNRLMVGTKVSLDYDILDYGGFPLKNTIFVGIKF